MSTADIFAAATRHAELTSAIQSHDQNAPAESQKLQSLILDLEKDILSSKKELKTKVVTRNKMKDQSVLGNSIGWRIVYTMSGKKERYEEKVYQEKENIAKALLEELDAKKEVDRQELLLTEFYASRSRLEQEVQQIMSLTSKLDDLYDSIFAGSSEHPEEEACEQQVKLALATLADIDVKHAAELRALKFLEAAESKMASLCDHYKESLPTFATKIHYGKDHHKRQMILEKAGRMLSEAQNLVIQAKFIQPLVQPIPPISPKATLHVYEQVSQASRAAKLSLKALKNQITAEKRWIMSLHSGLEELEDELNGIRVDLRQMRKAIFEHIISRGSNLPPEYEE